MTSACLLAHAQYTAEGVADYAARIMELLLLVEEIAFTAVSHRLAQRLLDRPALSALAAQRQRSAAWLGH